MKEEEMLCCLIAFILGWLVCRMMGNGFSVGIADIDYHASWNEFVSEHNSDLGGDFNKDIVSYLIDSDCLKHMSKGIKNIYHKIVMIH